MVVLEDLRGTPIFANPVDVTAGDYLSVNNIIVTTPDRTFISNLINELNNDYQYFSGTIDLSACGDNVEIPSSALGSETITIYVNSVAHDRYSTYNNVQVKN